MEAIILNSLIDLVDELHKLGVTIIPKKVLKRQNLREDAQ